MPAPREEREGQGEEEGGCGFGDGEKQKGGLVGTEAGADALADDEVPATLPARYFLRADSRQVGCSPVRSTRGVRWTGTADGGVAG